MGKGEPDFRFGSSIFCSIKYLLSTYDVPSTLLDTWDLTVNKNDNDPCAWVTYMRVIYVYFNKIQFDFSIYSRFCLHYSACVLSFGWRRRNTWTRVRGRSLSQPSPRNPVVLTLEETWNKFVVAVCDFMFMSIS